MRKSFIFEYIKSYLVVLVVAIILMAVANFVNIKVMEKDTIQKNSLLLEHVKTLFDFRFIDISNLSLEIERNEHNENIMKTSIVDMNDVYRLIKDLYIYKITNHLIKDIYIYYPAHNIAVTNAGAFTLKGFYKLNYKYDDQQFSDYVKMLNENHFRDYRVSVDTELNGDIKTNMNYYHSFPSGTQNPMSAILCIKIDTGKMVKEIDNIALSSSEYFAVLDDDNTLISSSGNESLANLITGMHFERSSSISVMAEDSTIISHITSSFNNINYVSIYGKNKLLKTISMLRNILIYCVLFVFAVDFLIAFYFTKKNEKPIKTITEALGGDMPNKHVEAGVYQYIEGRIKSIIDENKSISSKLRKQTSLLKNVFLSRLLRGEIIDKSTYIQLATSYSIDISRETYAVMLIYIDSVSPVVMQNTSDSDEHTDELSILVKTIIIETFKGQASVEIVDLDGIYTALLTLNFKGNQESLFLEYVDKLVHTLMIDYTIDVRIAVGSLCKSFKQITMSYNEAFQTLEHLISSKNRKYLSYSSLKNTERRDKVRNLDILSAFVNCMKLQDFNNALTITDQLFSSYLCITQPSEVYSFRKGTVVSVVLDMMEHISLQYDNGFPYQNYYMMIISAMNQHEKLKETVKGIIRATIEYKQKMEFDDSKKYINTLKDYIDKNYSNPDLGLYMIADVFCINNSYLSKIFKKEFNIGVLNYINKIRIEKAKELLATTEMNIVQISKEVGYISDITFIRVFKRHEGTTPGKYREIQSQA